MCLLPNNHHDHIAFFFQTLVTLRRLQRDKEVIKIRGLLVPYLKKSDDFLIILGVVAIVLALCSLEVTVASQWLTCALTFISHFFLKIPWEGAVDIDGVEVDGYDPAGRTVINALITVVSLATTCILFYHYLLVDSHCTSCSGIMSRFWLRWRIKCCNNKVANYYFHKNKRSYSSNLFEQYYYLCCVGSIIALNIMNTWCQ